MTASETGSVEETIEAGRALGARLREGDVVYLDGDLGTGKTHFVKGLAAGLGLSPDDVRSPTFTFVDVHRQEPPRLGLVHVDLYRIAHVAELTELGLEEAPGPGEVLALEWPDRLATRVEGAITVRITDLGESRRRIEIAGGR